MIFDSHAHYDSEAFDADREQLLAELPKKGVCGIINAATTLKSAAKSIELAHNFDYVYAAVGIHPLDVESVEEMEMGDVMSRLAEFFKDEKVVAVGEIGLDYHYDSPRDLQMSVIKAQLELVKSYNMPVILHDREAHGKMMDLMREYRPIGVMHCFSGSVEMANELVKMGLYIGLGGVVTFKNAVEPLKVAAAVPRDRLILETDAPYMAPVPFRGKRCDSSMILQTAEKIAQLRGETTEEVLEYTAENARRLFSI